MPDNYIQTVIVGGGKKNKVVSTIKATSSKKNVATVKNPKTSKTSECKLCNRKLKKGMSGGGGCGCSAGESMGNKF
jgi:hypothetical protein